MEDLPGRLISFIKYLGLNNSRFADEISVQRSGISHILSGRNKPGMDFISKILDTYPELNPDWLIMGRGEMLKTSENIVQSPIGKDQPSGDTGNKLEQKVLSFSEKPAAVIEKKKSRPVKSIEKIVIFFNDGTFHTYSPDQ